MALISGAVIRARDLHQGDDFETIHTKAAGVVLEGSKSACGTPVELWYSDDTKRFKGLHPDVKVRLLARFKKVA